MKINVREIDSETRNWIEMEVLEQTSLFTSRYLFRFRLMYFRPKFQNSAKNKIIEIKENNVKYKCLM
jgi:hypothetical protein